MSNSPNLGSLFDAPGASDPEGGDLRGVAPGYNFEKGALGHPELILISKDGREVTFYADAFEDHLHLHCPYCRLEGHEHGLMIRKGVREWLYEPMRDVPVFPGWDMPRTLITYPKGLGGRLQLAPVKCPWCRTQFAITDNVVRPV